MANRGSSEKDLRGFLWFPPTLEMWCSKASLIKEVYHMPQVNMGLTLGENEMNTYNRVSGKFGGCTT